MYGDQFDIQQLLFVTLCGSVKCK